MRLASSYTKSSTGNSPLTMDDLAISHLKEDDDFSGFSCGESDLDDFIMEDAFRNQRNGLTNTYVLYKGNLPVGFYSIVMESVRSADITDVKSFGIPSVAAVLVARLAVDSRYQGKCLGQALLYDAIYTAKELSRTIACRLVVVDSKPESAGFYEKHGFRQITALGRRRYPRYYLDLLTI